jgi:hypothetical protein
MAQTVVGLFDDRHDAEKAVRDFLDNKFAADRVSVVTVDSHGEFTNQAVTSKPGNEAGAGATAGALTGAVAGGIFGLLVGTGILLIPGVGVFAAGPIVAALGVGIGAAAGGLLGGLIGLGIPKDQASTYAEAIRRGGCLVAVEVHESEVMRADKIMKKHGAIDIMQRSAYYESQGFRGYDPKAPAYTPEQIAEERARLQTHWATAGSIPPAIEEEVVKTRYNNLGDMRTITYEQWEPAYRFGWRLGHDAHYQSFNHGEAAIKQMWEQDNPGTFNAFREAIFAGFNDAFARRSGPKMM